MQLRLELLPHAVHLPQLPMQPTVSPSPLALAVLTAAGTLLPMAVRLVFFKIGRSDTLSKLTLLS